MMLKRVTRFSARAISAIVDQGLVGVLSLLALVLAGRLLTARDYALFAVAYSVYLLVYAAHSATLSEPILVLGQAARDERGIAVRQFIASTNNWLAASGVVLFGASFVFPVNTLPSVAAAAGGAALCSVLAWERRRLAYLSSGVVSAPLQSALHLAAFSALALIISATYHLTPRGFFLALGVSGLVVGIASRILGEPLPTGGHWSADRAGARRDVTQYAAASLATAGVVWFASNFGYLLLSSGACPLDVSSLRAVMNFVLPWQQITIGLGMIVTTRVAATASGGSQMSFARWRRAAIVVGAMGAVYGLLLWWTGAFLLRLAYDGRYDHVAALLVYAPILGCLWGIQGILASAIRGMNQVRRIFLALTAGNLVGWLSCTVLMPALTAEAVILAIIILHSVAVVVLACTTEVGSHAQGSPLPERA